MSDWISTEMKMPGYGEPVLLVINGIVQHVTYMRDGCDETKDWFEPYFFDSKENSVWWDVVSHWMPLPEAPK